MNLSAIVFMSKIKPVLFYSNYFIVVIKVSLSWLIELFHMNVKLVLE